MTVPAIAFFDLHCNTYSQFSQHHDRLKNCLLAIDDVFKAAVQHNAKTILFGGDLGDLPKYVYISVIDSLCLRLSKWFNKYPDITMFVISGNHDQNSKNYWEKPAKTLLRVFATAFPDRFVLIDNTAVQIEDTDCYVAGIPYYENKSSFDKALDAQVEALGDKNDGSAKVTLLIHQTPEGVYNKHLKAETSPADPRYKLFDAILCGHIHTSQLITPKFLIGGSPLHRDLGDIGNEKGIWLIDLANPTKHKFISRKGRYPEFLRKEAEDITEEDHKTSFPVPLLESRAVVVEGSADAEQFSTAATPEELLRNYWQETDGKDERLLKVGLSLLQ